MTFEPAKLHPHIYLAGLLIGTFCPDCHERDSLPSSGAEPFLPVPLYIDWVSLELAVRRRDSGWIALGGIGIESPFEANMDSLLCQMETLELCRAI